jgi:protein-glutamine gamma-glutamyltransferase
MPELLLRLNRHNRLRLTLALQTLCACLLWMPIPLSIISAIPLAIVFAAISWMTLMAGCRANGPVIHKSISQTLAAILLIMAAGLGWLLDIPSAAAFALSSLQWPLYLQGRHSQALRMGLLSSAISTLLMAPVATGGLWLLLLSLFWVIWLISLVQVRQISLAGTEPEQGVDETATINPDPQTADSKTHTRKIRLTIPLLLPISAGLICSAWLVWLLLPLTEPQTLLFADRHANTWYQNKDWFGQAGRRGDENRTSSVLTKASQTAQEGPSGLWETVARETPQFDYPGFADELALQQTPFPADNTRVLKVRSPVPLYLKVHTFDFFDGKRWTSSSLSYQKLTADSHHQTLNHYRLDTYLPASCPDSAQSAQTYEVTLLQALPAWLPVAATTTTLQLPADVIALDNWLQPLLPEAIQPGTRYRGTVSGRMESDHPIACSVVPAKPDLRLPAADSIWLKELASTITAQGNSDMAKARLLESYMRSHFQATDTASANTTSDRSAVENLLRAQKPASGETIASSLAMLLRSIEIPARLATGFAATRFNPVSGDYEVHQQDGHAWVEAWINQHWVILEGDNRFQLPVKTRYQNRADALYQWLDNESPLFYPYAVLYWVLLWPLGLILHWGWPILLPLLLMSPLMYYPPLQTILAEAANPLHKLWWLTRIHHYKPTTPERDLRRTLPWLMKLASLAGCQRKTGETMEAWSLRLSDELSECQQEDLSVLEKLVNQYFYESPDQTSQWQRLLNANQADPLQENEPDAAELKQLLVEIAIQIKLSKPL